MRADSSAEVVAHLLRREVERLRGGDRLPPSRVLRQRYQVSPGTVSRAVQILAAEGLVVIRPGSGTFVAHRTAPQGPDAPNYDWQQVTLAQTPQPPDPTAVGGLLAPPPVDTIPLHSAYLHPTLQPAKAVATATYRAVRRPDAWGYPPLAGITGLRHWFATAVGGRFGDLTAQDVTITGGGLSALTTTLQALVPPGTAVLAESPTYPGMLSAARSMGLRVVPVPADHDGIRPDLLAEVFALTGARALYLQPTFHNPTGTVLAHDRRAAVLEAAAAAGAFVIEDDHARHLAIDPAPLPLVVGDHDGRVVHIASLTKPTSPSLRIAGLVARGPAAARILAVQVAHSAFPARPLQEAALELLSSEAWPRHLRVVSGALRRRRDALVRALAQYTPHLCVDHIPAGGLNLWARLPDGVSAAAAATAAERAGVLVSPAAAFFPAEPDGAFLRISYGLARSESEVAEGARRLGAALAELRAPLGASR